MQKAHDLGHPLHGQPDKEMELDEFGRLRVVAGQLVEHLVHRKDISVSGRRWHVVREFDLTALAAPTQSLLAPSALDEFGGKEHLKDVSPFLTDTEYLGFTQLNDEPKLFVQFRDLALVRIHDERLASERLCFNERPTWMGARGPRAAKSTRSGTRGPGWPG
jgi:hypothetical protein